MGKETKIGMMIETETKELANIYEKLVKTVEYELEKGIEQVETAEMKEVADMIKDFSEAKKNIVKACYYVYIMEAMEKAEEEEEDEDGEEEMMGEMRRGYRGQPRDSMGRFTSRRGRGRGRGRRRGYEEQMYFEMTPEMYNMYPAEYYRDMDKEQMQRMYYSGGGSGSAGGSSSGGASSQGGGQGGSQGGGQSSGGSGGSSGGMSGGSSSGGGSRGYEESQGNRGGQQRDSREGRSGQSRRSYMESKEMGKEKGEKMKELENYMKELSEDVTEMIQGASAEEKALLKQKMQVLMQKF